MAIYITEATYTPEGMRGLAKDSASGRQAAVKAAVKSVGGKLEGFYFGAGGDTVIVIGDYPDAIAAARLGTAVASSGMVTSTTKAMLTVAEMDKALGKGAKYKAPGE